MKRFLAVGAAAVGGYALWQAVRPKYDFRGKNVLITGGSRGLGLVLGRELAGRGANLAVCGRDMDELQAAVGDLLNYNTRVVGVRCDVTDRDAVKRFVAAARREIGPCDVLVNNAGIIGVGPLETQTVADFEASLNTHLYAALYTTLEVLPDMKARGAGRIVNVSSIGGKVAIPHMLSYSVGKFALVGLSAGLRAELSRHGVVVTTVCPGLMRTGSHLHAEFKGRHEEEYRWFALGDSVPGFSMSAESAARRVADACARGDAEVVLSLPAKLAVALQGVFPGLTSTVLGLVNHHVLPEPGGVGTERVKGRDSRGKTPEAVTTLTDRAADRNNEHHAGVPSVG